MAYQKITDLFIATATDYNPKSEEAYAFFKIVQNKLHYAISGHTAAELIYSRANSDKEHMGLTNWKNSPDGLIYKYDVVIAKNYLNEEEMNNLKDLTNMSVGTVLFDNFLKLHSKCMPKVVKKNRPH